MLVNLINAFRQWREDVALERAAELIRIQRETAKMQAGADFKNAQAELSRAQARTLEAANAVPFAQAEALRTEAQARAEAGRMAAKANAKAVARESRSRAWKEFTESISAFREKSFQLRQKKQAVGDHGSPGLARFFTLLALATVILTLAGIYLQNGWIFVPSFWMTVLFFRAASHYRKGRNRNLGYVFLPRLSTVVLGSWAVLLIIHMRS